MAAVGVELFSLSTEPLDTAALARELTDDGAGACVVFEGRARNSTDGRSVEWLEYEAYETLALKEGSRIVEQAVSANGIIAARCVHRVGHLSVGDVAVWVGAIAAHRDEAFRACRQIIDEVKSQVPIWKKERFADGETVWAANSG